MVESILIVEGWDDKAFFEILISKVFERKPEELGLDIRIGDDKKRAKDALRLYVRQRFIKIGIARDIDDSSPQDVEGFIRDNLASELGSPIKSEKGIFLIGKSQVIAIPMGLYNDEELKNLGINRCEMEDYLVKLALLKSPKRPDKRLKDLLKDMYHLGKSKEFLQPLKAPFKFSDDDRAFARFLIGRSDKAIITEITSNILSKIEALIGEQR
jgi:hypothetical protein